MSPLLTPRGSTRRWRRLRALVLERDGHRCQLDGCGAYATHVDHVIPRSKGGTDALGNLRAACAACNLRRGARSVTPDPVRRGGEGWAW